MKKKFTTRNKELIRKLYILIGKYRSGNFKAEEVRLLNEINTIVNELIGDVSRASDWNAFKRTIAELGVVEVLSTHLGFTNETRCAFVLNRNGRRAYRLWRDEAHMMLRHNAYAMVNAHNQVERTCEIKTEYGPLNKRYRREGDRYSATLSEFSAIGLDLDMVDGVSCAEVLDTLTQLQVPPTMVINTARGFHVFFVLDKHVDFTSMSLAEQCVATETVAKISTSLAMMVNSLLPANVVDVGSSNSLGLLKIPFNDYQKVGQPGYTATVALINNRVNLADLVNMSMSTNLASTATFADIKVGKDVVAEATKREQALCHAILNMDDRHYGVARLVTDESTVTSAVKPVKPASTVASFTSAEVAGNVVNAVNQEGCSKQWRENFDNFAPADIGNDLEEFLNLPQEQQLRILGIPALNTIMSMNDATMYVRTHVKFSKIMGVEVGQKVSSPVYSDRNPSAQVKRITTSRGYAVEFITHYAPGYPSGDIVEMVRYVTGCSHSEAVVTLAKIFGIAVVGSSVQSDARVEALGYTKAQLETKLDVYVQEMQQFISFIGRILLENGIARNFTNSLLAVAGVVIDAMVDHQERLTSVDALRLQTFAAVEFVQQRLMRSNVSMSDKMVTSCLKMLALLDFFRVVPVQSIICKMNGHSPFTVEAYPNVNCFRKSALKTIIRLVNAGWCGTQLLVGNNKSWSRAHVERILGAKFVSDRVDGVVVGLPNVYQSLCTAADNARFSVRNRERRAAAFAEAEKPLRLRTAAVSFSKRVGKVENVEAWENFDLKLSGFSADERCIVAAAEQLELSYASGDVDVDLIENCQLEDIWGDLDGIGLTGHDLINGTVVRKTVHFIQNMQAYRSTCRVAC